MRKYKGARSIKSSSRKRSLGKIKVNYNSLVNKEVESFLRVHGAKIKAEDPEKYYSMINKPLPKKYLRKNYPIAPVNAYVPPQSKLSTSEREALEEKEAKDKKIKQDKDFKVQQEKTKEKQRLAYNEATFYKQQRLVHWCNAYEQGNYVSIHSDKFKSRGKKYEYY